MRFEPGTIVKLATSELGRRRSPAILLNGYREHVVTLLTDGGTATAMGFEVTVPRTSIKDFVPMRLRLPYGEWREKDGTRVLFSRDYCPLWKIAPDGKPAADDPWRLVKHVQQSWFWKDHNTPWRNRETLKRMEGLLAELGIGELPKLVQAIHHMVGNARGAARDIHEAVHRMTPGHVLNSAPRLIYSRGSMPAAVGGALN